MPCVQLTITAPVGHFCSIRTVESSLAAATVVRHTPSLREFRAGGGRTRVHETGGHVIRRALRIDSHTEAENSCSVMCVCECVCVRLCRCALHLCYTHFPLIISTPAPDNMTVCPHKDVHPPVHVALHTRTNCTLTPGVANTELGAHW